MNLNIPDRVLAIFPLCAPVWLLLPLLDNPAVVVMGWAEQFLGMQSKNDLPEIPPVGSQLLAFTAVAVGGFFVTSKLIPQLKMYTLRKGISGKDLGKKGTSTADKEIPEALGIVSGTIFLVCLIFCLVGYATSYPTKLLDLNSALLSICFMLFLGFTDDVLDWPWRYKLFLPSVASLPLLCCYNGSTSIVVPIQMRTWIMRDNELTPVIGRLLSYIIEIDHQANGSLVDLRFLYLIYMGLLAVFCTNAINIYAGINGLECGQSYVIACAVLVHNFIEIRAQVQCVENHVFSAMVMMSFVGVTLGLLRHNWFPASVFVGDTFCYFAGMTFAVVGILGHFSKTLLLFFIPQVFNFLWSVPQLFKLVPCPRHRLPAFNHKTGKMEPSRFECKATDYRWLKLLTLQRSNATEMSNMTVINLCLQIGGPMTERQLCTLLMALQALCCGLGLFIRYYIAKFFFDE